MKRAPAAELTVHELAEKPPPEPQTDPHLAKHEGYWPGSAGGQLQRLRADRDKWKARALAAEDLLRRIQGDESGARLAGMAVTGGEDI